MAVVIVIDTSDKMFLNLKFKILKFFNVLPGVCVFLCLLAT